MDWCCAKAHRWASPFRSVNSGNWCRVCANTSSITIADCRSLSEKHGGQCLSLQYINSYTNLKWLCALNHTWSARYDSVKQGCWCPYCAGVAIHTIEECHILARSKRGFCLSTEYASGENLLWKCSQEHTWYSRIDSIISGTWCNQCRRSKGQEELTAVLSTLFPAYSVVNNFRGFGWLKTTGAGKQEIDIWMPGLKLAVEYDGEQHFSPVRFGGISLEMAKERHERIKTLDLLKNGKIADHKDDVSVFVRFNYTEPLTPEYVLDKLMRGGVVLYDY
jgi:hypothetical protein